MEQATGKVRLRDWLGHEYGVGSLVLVPQGSTMVKAEVEAIEFPDGVTAVTVNIVQSPYGVVTFMPTRVLSGQKLDSIVALPSVAIHV